MASVSEIIIIGSQVPSTYRKNITNNSTITFDNVSDTCQIHYEYLFNSVFTSFTPDQQFTTGLITSYDNFQFKAGSFTIKAVYNIYNNIGDLIETINGANQTLTLVEIKPVISVTSNLGCCIPYQQPTELITVSSYTLNSTGGTPTINYRIESNDGSIIDSGLSYKIFTKTASGAANTLSLSNGNFAGFDTFFNSLAKKSYTITLTLVNNTTNPLGGNYTYTETFQLNICDNYKVEYINCNQVKVTNYNSSFPLIFSIKQFNDAYQFETIPYSNSAVNTNVPTTSMSGDGTTVTLIFATISTPFIVGQQITVTGGTPIAYNGIFTVLSSTTTSVTYTSTATGTQTVAASISQSTILNLNNISLASNQSILIQLPNDNLYEFISSFNGIDNIKELVILDCNMNNCKKNVTNNYYKFKDTCDTLTLKKLQLDFLEFIALEFELRGKWAYYKNQRIDIEVNAINKTGDLLSLKTALDRLNSICSGCGRLDVTVCDPNIVTTFDFTKISSDCGCN